MPEKKPIPKTKPSLEAEAEEENTDAETCILAWLLDDDYQRPWSVDEVLREYGDRIAATDAIENLRGNGLIHRMGDFVFATRAAVRAEEIKF
jgi:hypothetical protein